jgi:heterodisulfide reductase subunit C
MRERLGLDACFQCSRCSVGCTVAEVTDLLPHRIVRLAQLGQQEQLLRAEHLWLCTGCGTCTTRCPNQVQVAELMDHLKAEAFPRQAAGGGPAMVRFHALFHDAIYRYGRNHEMGLVRRLKTTRELLADMGMGLSMMRRGKLKLRAQKVRDREVVRDVYRRAGLVKEGS